MCSHISVEELTSKRGMTVKNINFVLVQMSHSLKVPYTSSIFFGGRGGGCFFQILSLQRSANSKRGAYLKLGTNTSINGS